jgi:hypothetical protein
MSAPSATTALPRRGSRRAFRIVAGILGVLGLLLSVPFTVISFFDEAESIHRMHYLSARSGASPEPGR